MSELKFVDFFQEIHQRLPFPWQARLAERLIKGLGWPSLVDLPTASGKTACLDIALFHLAWCAERGEPWRASRRIVYVVDRRIIVDSVAERAELLLRALTERRTDTVARMANALQSLTNEKETILSCLRLRGGMPRERSIVLNPGCPMIITSTVDQVGSRLLFRGYGLSSYARPVHAGLLGYDTLLLIDEAHLSLPFLATLHSIRREQARAEAPLRSVQSVRYVSLSATAEDSGEKFQLDATDLAHPELGKRRTVAKPATLRLGAKKEADRCKDLHQEALVMYRSLPVQNPLLAIIVNRVRTARMVYEMLRKDAAEMGFDVELLTGRSRPLERDSVSKRVLERAGTGADRGNRDRGLIVVATQTIEVGADLDFEGLVTECASLAALRQRFGRLDRLGNFKSAKGVIIGEPESSDDPVYGSALSGTWVWLQSVAKDGVVDFSIAEMEKVLENTDLQPMTVKIAPRLTLTPTHVELLSQTCPAPMADPDIQALLHGLKSPPADVQLVWRTDVPTVDSVKGPVLDLNESRLAAQLVELNPPTSLESMSLPVHTVRAWLLGLRDLSPLTDIEGVPTTEDEARRIDSFRHILRHSHDEWRSGTAYDIRPGDTIVVPASYGGCDQFGFSPESTDEVVDLSAVARTILKKSSQVVITEQWLRSGGLDSERAKVLWSDLEDSARSLATPDELAEIVLDGLTDDISAELSWIRADRIVDILRRKDESLYALVVSERYVSPQEISDEDMSSSQTLPVRLSNHNAGVGIWARKLARSTSLDNFLIEDLGCSGDLHDVGKADPRFQRMLRSGADVLGDSEPLAKGVRGSSFYPAEPRERHEAYSVGLIKQHPHLLSGAADPELVTYLIGVHHGRGRSFMPDTADDGVRFSIALDGHCYGFDGVPALGTLGSDWPALFWRMNRRYGPWGLAYLEMILRMADWIQSVHELSEHQGVARR